MGIYAVAAAYSLASTQLWPDQNLPTVRSLIEWWDWKMWVIVALLLITAAALEGTYRQSRKSGHRDGQAAETNDAQPSSRARRQRTQIGDLRPPNRDSLLRVMSEVQGTTAELLQQQEWVNARERQSPNTIPTEALIAKDTMYSRYKRGLERLRAEKLVAGDEFEQLLSDLIDFIARQVMLLTVRPSLYGEESPPLPEHTASALIERIAAKVKETAGKIDEIGG